MPCAKAAAAAGSTKLSIFWKRDDGSESAPTDPGTGDHMYGVMLAIRGYPTTSDPDPKKGAAGTGTPPSAGQSRDHAAKAAGA